VPLCDDDRQAIGSAMFLVDLRDLTVGVCALCE